MTVPDLLSKAKIDSLSKFVRGTVLTCFDVEMRPMSNGDSAPIVLYETFITNEKGDLENTRGRVFIPMGYTDEL